MPRCRIKDAANIQNNIRITKKNGKILFSDSDCCPARIAVSASASLSLIGVAYQQGDVGTYRQGASVVFQNERIPVQRTDVYKRRYAKGRPAEVQWHPFFVVASSGRLTCRTHLPVRPYIAGPRIAVLHASRFFLFLLIPDFGCRSARRCRDVPTRCVRCFSK